MMKINIIPLKFQLLVWCMVGSSLMGVRAQERLQENYQLEVSYSFLLNQGDPLTFDGILFVGAESSLFTYHTHREQNDGELSVEPSAIDQQSFNFKIRDTTTYYIWSQSTASTVFHLERLLGENTFCAVREEFPEISWQITGKQKLIQDFTCYEAQGNFGGRDYTAWFTKEIPTPYGPWKFHGLPGLIVELEDRLGEVQFFVKSIRSVPATFDPYNPFLNESFQTMDRASYIAEVKRYISNLEKRMASRVGRGLEVKVTSRPIRSIEIYDF